VMVLLAVAELETFAPALALAVMVLEASPKTAPPAPGSSRPSPNLAPKVLTTHQRARLSRRNGWKLAPVSVAGPIRFVNWPCPSSRVVR
jgi:hypothetical protein